MVGCAVIVGPGLGGVARGLSGGKLLSDFGLFHFILGLAIFWSMFPFVSQAFLLGFVLLVFLASEKGRGAEEEILFF